MRARAHTHTHTHTQTFLSSHESGLHVWWGQMGVVMQIANLAVVATTTTTSLGCYSFSRYKFERSTLLLCTVKGIYCKTTLLYTIQTMHNIV